MNYIDASIKANDNVHFYLSTDSESVENDLIRKWGGNYIIVN